MNKALSFVAALVAGVSSPAAAGAADDPNPALTDPDMTSWELFLEVNADAKTAGNNDALFETWASDADTFKVNPQWPTTPSVLALKPRALSLVARLRKAGGLLPQVVAGGAATEETRRNRPDFDFIKDNNLYKVSGLATAFSAGKTLSFPTNSLEVKGNWVLVENLKDFNGFTGAPAEAAKLYHVNTATDPKTGKKLTYALVAMHVISKLVPNWTWATFEHKDNPGRCDVLGCANSFGAQAGFHAAAIAYGNVGREQTNSLRRLRQNAGAARAVRQGAHRSRLHELLPERFADRLHRCLGTGQSGRQFRHRTEFRALRVLHDVPFARGV